MENQIFIKLKKFKISFIPQNIITNILCIFLSATILVYLVITLHIFPNFTIPWNDKRMAERTNKKKVERSKDSSIPFVANRKCREKA